MKDDSTQNPSDPRKTREASDSAPKKRLKLAPLKPPTETKPPPAASSTSESAEERSHRLKLSLDRKFKGKEESAEEETPEPATPSGEETGKQDPPENSAEEVNTSPAVDPPETTDSVPQKPEALEPVPAGPADGPTGPAEPDKPQPPAGTPPAAEEKEPASSGIAMAAPAKPEHQKPKFLKINASNKKPAKQETAKAAKKSSRKKKAKAGKKPGLKGLFLMVGIAVILILGAGLLLLILNPFGDELAPIVQLDTTPSLQTTETEQATPSQNSVEAPAQAGLQVEVNTDTYQFLEILKSRPMRPSRAPRGLFIDSVFVPEGAVLNPELGLSLETVERGETQTIVWLRDEEDQRIPITVDR